MQHERFGRIRSHTAKESNEEELRLAQQAYEEADPTTYSTLPIQHSLDRKGTVERYGYQILTDGTDIFYQLPYGTHPQKQQVVQRLLKGIVNVSDLVVRNTGEKREYVSKETPLEKIQSRTSDDEIYADISLLTDVFDDSDRSYYPKDPRGFGIPQHNLAYENGKISYHDFGEASISERNGRVNIPQETIAIMEYELAKVAELIERFAGEQGREFFFDILKSAHAEVRSMFPRVFEGNRDTVSTDEDYFYTVFMERLHTLTGALQGSMIKKRAEMS